VNPQVGVADLHYENKTLGIPVHYHCLLTSVVISWLAAFVTTSIPPRRPLDCLRLFAAVEMHVSVDEQCARHLVVGTMDTALLVNSRLDHGCVASSLHEKKHLWRGFAQIVVLH